MQSPECDVIFLLIGDGQAIPQLEEQIHKHNLEDTVKLLGFRNDVLRILCISDIAFHAAMGEGFSLSIIEYMSAGLPVLVPDIASVSQAITHDKTGLVYQHNDPISASSYLEKLVTDKNKRFSMGAAAKIEANDKYNLEQCTQNFIQAIKSIYA